MKINYWGFRQSFYLPARNIKIQGESLSKKKVKEINSLFQGALLELLIILEANQRLCFENLLDSKITCSGTKTTPFCFFLTFGWIILRYFVLLTIVFSFLDCCFRFRCSISCRCFFMECNRCHLLLLFSWAISCRRVTVSRKSRSWRNCSKNLGSL